MLRDFVFNFYRLLENDSLSLLYQGDFQDEIVPKIIALSEFNLEKINEPVKFKNRVSFLIAECFQNVLRHGEKTESQENSNFFFIRNIASTFVIFSANLLRNEKVDELKKQLEDINRLDEDGLKMLHKQILQFGGLSDKGGAGLGLISIAQKSGKEILYDFSCFSENTSFFFNQVSISLNSSESNKKELIALSDSVELFHKIKHENILLLKKGDFEHKSIVSLLKILDKNVQDNPYKSIFTKEIYHVMVELMQNIGEHCLQIEGKKEGILIITAEGNDFCIHTGNFIAKNKIEEFEKHLLKINTLSKKELKSWYLRNLKAEKENNATSAKVGLIDVGRVCSEPIKYSFEAIDSEISFVSLSVSL